MKNKSLKIAGIGELLWDVLPQGKQLGGAPCNFAFHFLQAGFDPFVISAVGEDSNGTEILRVMDQLELGKTFVQITPAFPTGTVTVELDAAGIPNYSIHENVAWDHINLRQSFYDRETVLHSLDLANVLKLNKAELPVVGDFFGYSGNEEQMLARLLDDFRLQLIAYTKGSQGSMLRTPTEKSYHEVPSVKLAYTVGAGDSLTAILVAGMLKGLPLNETHALATEVAAFVCTQHGATPKLPAHLLKQLLIY